MGLLVRVFLFILKDFGKNATQNRNTFTLACNDFTSHAMYDVSAWRGTGTLSFVFNTGKSDSFIAYQDDQSFSYFDFFLVDGKMQTTVNFDNCRSQLTIEGNYSDAKWHRVRFERRQRKVRLSIDGCHFQTIRCNISGPSRENWYALYVGSIPFGISRNSLAAPIILDRALQSKFQGCIGQVTLTVPKKDPEAFPLHSPASSTPRFHEQCFIGELCNKETDNITGIECECPGYEIERLLLKCNNPDTTNTVHAHTFPTIFPRVQDSRQLFSTPMFMHTNQPRIPSTEIPSSNFTMNSTRAQLASSYSPEHAQFENKTSLVPGFSTSSRKYDAFVTTSSAEVISSPTVNTKIAAIARGNKAAVERDHNVMVYLAFLILIQKVIIRN